MQIWLSEITTSEDDGKGGGSVSSKQALHRSEAAARQAVGTAEGTSGDVRLVEIDTDKEGVIALFARDAFVKNVIKAFDVKNGKWKARA